MSELEETMKFALELLRTERNGLQSRLDNANAALGCIAGTPPVSLEAANGMSTEWWIKLVTDMRNQAVEAQDAATVVETPSTVGCIASDDGKCQMQKSIDALGDPRDSVTVGPEIEPGEIVNPHVETAVKTQRQECDHIELARVDAIGIDRICRVCGFKLPLPEPS